jgi:hypothetical protein
MLKAGVMEDGTVRETLAGTPQGGVISPLLANIYLHLLDRLWAAKCAGIIARAHQQLGELVEALRVLEPARATLGELDVPAEAARLQLATAEVFLTAGLFSEAHAEAAAAAEHPAAQGMVHDNGVAILTLALEMASPPPGIVWAACQGSGTQDEVDACERGLLQQIDWSGHDFPSAKP